MIARAQLSLVETPRVVLEYHPARQPPDASGPFEHGTFSARLAGGDAPTAWGRGESLALTALAEDLRDFAAQREPVPALSALGQAIAAARRMPLDGLVRWLSEHAEDAVLHEATPDRIERA